LQFGGGDVEQDTFHPCLAFLAPARKDARLEGEGARVVAMVKGKASRLFVEG